MKTGKEETTCLLGVAGKCSVEASVHVPVNGKKDWSPGVEPLIKDGKKRKSCLLDGGKRVVHFKARGDSLGMEKSA